jgi:SulP family sulfate permease
MGVLRFGRLIEFIPYPVTTGFTAGIGVVIATLQVKDFLGLKIDQMPFHYTERVSALWSGAREKFGSGDFSLGNLSEVLVGIGTLLVLVLWPRWNRKVPPALVAMPLAAIVVWACNAHVPGFHADTIRSRFATAEVPHGVSASLPTPVLPWNEPGPRDTAGTTHPLHWPWSPNPAPADAVKMDTDAVRTLLTTSLVVAMLGAIATLLSAVVADGLIAKRHDPDAELAAQGIGNIVSPFFGGFASTGAIARTLVNVRAGGRSPIAGMTHAIVLMAALLITAPLMGHMPMAAMAALLLSVARNMVEPRHFVFLLRYAPKSDAVVLIVCFVLTVIFDMALAVGAGVSLAAILFMRRMAEVSNIKLVGSEHPALKVPVPEGLVIYDVGGPLFFGAAQRALGAVADVGTGVRVVILDLTDVPTLDATAMVTLDSVMSRLSQRKVFVVLAGVHDSVLSTMHRAGWDERGGNLAVAGDLETGIEIARAYVEG